MIELFHDGKLSVKAISVLAVFRLLDRIELRITVFNAFNCPVCALADGHFELEEFVKLGLRNDSGLDELTKDSLSFFNQIIRFRSILEHI
jgi:hypothetical protein